MNINILDSLQKLVETFGENLKRMKANNGKDYNETTCRNEYINKLLEILGWDVSNNNHTPPEHRDVFVEVSSENSGIPDYSLALDGNPKFYVEAKKPAVDICNSNESALQARRYGWNASHKIVVLTNFEYLIIYNATIVPNEKDSPDVALFKKYKYTDYVSKFSEISKYISHEAVYSGNFDKNLNSKILRSNHDVKSVDEHFLDQINTWRLELANTLYNKGGDYSNIDILNDEIQKFINQIVFLRICEDKKLPLYHSLQENIKDTKLLHQKLKEMFMDADKKYNSGIFSGKNILFDLNNDVILKIIKGLYYPQSPYLFNIISPHILGKMYEMFLTETLTLDNGKIVLQHQVNYGEPIDRTVVTTGDAIVHHMVNKVLCEVCKNKTPKEIKQLRIADIACGSGIFLEEVFSQLQRYCVEWYLKNDENHLEYCSYGRRKLPFYEKKEILLNCIYGIDIDCHAVEVAKFSLLLKLIENETASSLAATNENKILPKVNNIFYGNALVDYTFFPKLDVNNKKLIKIAPFNWEDMKVNQGFDVIIGNPPYVSTKNMHKLFPDLEILKAYYQTAFKQFDMYFLFIERALNKLKDGGSLCFIVQNKFFKNNAGQVLRKIIAKGQYLKSIEDFGSSRLFSKKSTYSAIILLSKSKNSFFTYYRCQDAINLFDGINWDSIKWDSRKINANEIDDSPWYFITDSSFAKSYSKLKKISKPLTDYVSIKVGIQTSIERHPIYSFKVDANDVCEDAKYYYIKRNGKTYKIEKSILRLYFKPVANNEKGLNSYSVITTNKRIIFPYDKAGKLIPQNVMETKYPGTWEYLKDNYDELVPKSVSKNGRRDVPGATKDTWYSYARSQGIKIFNEGDKLIAGILSKEPLYIFDDQQMIIASGGTAGYSAIIKREGCNYDLKYIQAWLSNQHTTEIISHFGSDFSGGYKSKTRDVLSKVVRFVPLDLNDKSQRSLHDSVVSYADLIFECNQKLQKRLSRSEQQIIERTKKEYINRINEIIDKVYEGDF